MAPDVLLMHGPYNHVRITHPLGNPTGGNGGMGIVSTTSSFTLGPFYNNNVLGGLQLSRKRLPGRKKAKLKAGFQLDAPSIEDPKPAPPRRERRETRSPELVGGGPMRRRWR